MEYLALELTSIPVLDGTAGIITTAVVTVVVIVLAYIAQFMAKSGDVTAEIKRMAYLDKYDVRLQVRFSTTKKHPQECNDLFLAATINGVLRPITDITTIPVPGMGFTRLITKSERGYGFRISSSEPFEGHFDFQIHRDIDLNKCEKVYLVCTNEKGKKRKAEFVLASTSFQSLRFKRA